MTSHKHDRPLDRVALFLGRVVLAVLALAALYGLAVLLRVVLFWVIDLAAPAFWLGLALCGCAVLVGSCLAAREQSW